MFYVSCATETEEEYHIYFCETTPIFTFIICSQNPTLLYRNTPILTFIRCSPGKSSASLKWDHRHSNEQSKRKRFRWRLIRCLFALGAAVLPQRRVTREAIFTGATNFTDTCKVNSPEWPTRTSHLGDRERRTMDGDWWVGAWGGGSGGARV